MCECHVYEGGGDVLPTEMNHLTRKEAAEGMRLACQVKVRQDMKIGIPEEIFGIKKWECEVISDVYKRQLHLLPWLMRVDGKK